MLDVRKGSRKVGQYFQIWIDLDLRRIESEAGSAGPLARTRLGFEHAFT
jgi:hypothetical protein